MAKYDLLSSQLLSSSLLINRLINLDTFDNSSLLYKASFSFCKGKVAIEMNFQGIVLCSVLALWIANVQCFEDGQPMRFETPKMNEEEQHSPHTPKSFELTCDACTAIAYQVIKFRNFHYKEVLSCKNTSSFLCIIMLRYGPFVQSISPLD